jgi:hypothetical protein
LRERASRDVLGEMKFSRVLLAVGAMALGGCVAISDATSDVREKWESRNQGRTKTYAAQPRAVYEAVRLAAGQMGYRFVRGGAAQGELEAINGVATDDSRRGSRQIAMKVRLHGTLDEKGTDVTVRLTEIIEGDSANRAGMATETPLRDTPQYEVFFREVQKAVDAQSLPQKK